MPADQLHEAWDVYDRQLRIVGRQLRANPVAPGHYHLVVNAFVFNRQGQVLLQQRSLDKLNFPGYWDTSAGGAVKAGETIEAAMARELREELGLTVPITAADNYRLMPHSHWISAWFAVTTDWTVSDFTPQLEELQRVAYFSLPAAQQQLTQIGFDNYHLELQQAWAHLQLGAAQP